MVRTIMPFFLLPILLAGLVLSSVAYSSETETLANKDPVTLQLKWSHQFQFAGYYAAVEKGFYTEAGLDVTLRERNEHIEVTDAVLNGDADYGIAGAGLLAQFANGAPVKALAAIFQHDPLVFISKAESGISTPYELAGKRVMFNANIGNYAILHALLDDAGLRPDDFTMVPQQLSLERFINDEVDVISGYITDQPFTLRQMGYAINIIDPRNYGLDFYGDILLTSEQELRNNPGRADRFLRASLKGWQYALQNPEEIIQLIVEKYHPGLSKEQLRYEARETRKLIRPDIVAIGHIEPGRLRRTADFYHQAGHVPLLNQHQLSQFIHRSRNELNLTDEELAWLAGRSRIRVGVDSDFAPYEWINTEGEYVGIAAEYIRLIEQRIGVPFEIVSDQPWHETLAMAARGELDMMSCLNLTPERAEYLNFSQPYVNNPIVIVNANRHGYIGTLDNLSGQRVAVEQDYYVHEFLASHHPEIELVLTETTAEALNKVATGSAFAYVGDAAYANFAIKQGNLLNLQFAGQTEEHTAYRIGVHHSHPELFSIINKVLASISPEERQEIENRWLGLTFTSGVQTRTLLQFAVALTIIFAIYSYWLFRLRQSRQALARSEAKLRSILNASPIPYALNDDKQRVQYINKAFTDTFGYTIEDIPSVDVWWELAYPAPEYRSQVRAVWQSYMNSPGLPQREAPFEVEIRCKNGQIRHTLINSTAIADGTQRTHIVIFYDISERKRAEEKLKLSGRVFNQAHEGILITDAKGIIVDINPAFTTITGYARDEVIGQTPRLLKSGRHTEHFYQEMWQSLQEEGHWQGEVWNIRKNGELFAELLTISTLLDEHGETQHYLGLFSDITESKQQQNALEMMAHFDMLTQLPNRSLFADRFRQAIAHSERNHSLLAIIFLDLDNFKPVNDNFGHAAGDKILIEISRRLKSCIREDDTASRLGGDEFALLLNDISSIEHCQRLLSRLHRTIELPYQIEEETISLSASIGVTLYPLDNADADTLLRHADQAMYQAKQAGRNRHYLFDAVHDQQLSMQQNQLHVIEQAFRNQEFCLYYQPKIDMRSGQLMGAEALLRWQDPSRGIVTPAQFLQSMDGTDLAIRIGNWVIEQALKELNTLKQHELQLEISLNISSHHLQWEGFFTHLDHALSRYPTVDSSLLQLEILESSVLDDLHNISSIISKCRKALGVRIALDDFGTGYSSLTHLRHLPVDVVKIDQTFVRDIIDDPNDYTIVDGVIGLTQAFHHDVIAEGVETTEHGLMLLTMGCYQAQGYKIAHPMPVDQFLQWAKNPPVNASWQLFAKAQLSEAQRYIALIQLQTHHWWQRVRANVEGAPDHVLNWPIMNYKKCHMMAWLEQAERQHLFNVEWQSALMDANIDLYHCGLTLRNQIQQNQVLLAQAGLRQFDDYYEAVQLLLARYAGPIDTHKLR
ncbi:EAL domain-containing protein [Methylophaga lonarensis]|uniref:EAL domain-containing protein n=1 Tax=Methylophaga lonarensis TaxID=999151 RepID=UPI003D2E8676